MRTLLKAKTLWDGADSLEDPVIVIDENEIAFMASRATGQEPARTLTAVYDFPDATLAPAFFDVHIHGSAGHDVMEATPEALHAVGCFLASCGTASYLATTVSAPVDTTLRALSGLARLIENPGLIEANGNPGQPAARPLGIHLEGPFLSHEKRGAHPCEYLLPPDIGLFDRLFEAAEGHLRLITLAPELPGAAELAAHATARGVRVSVGHSDATAAQTRAAIAAGAASATHTFNAMRALDHREPGILGTVLTDDSLFAELICDGIHNTREMVKIWWRTKGPERAILVTDAMSAAGMPDGAYKLGGMTVQVADRRATINGVLAGSVLTLDRAVTNFIEFTGATVEQTLRLVTVNPSAMTRLSGHAGRLEVGQPANLVALDAEGRLTAAFVNGKAVTRCS